MTSTSDLQAQIVEARASRGFTSDPVRLVVLLAEEVGEIAREVKKTWSPNDEAFEADGLALRLADAFVLLAALASEAGIDLGAAAEDKFFGDDAGRNWPSAGPGH
jgi:NTP pyrophosphatase (non-canonical NTP hydrolase)